MTEHPRSDEIVRAAKMSGFINPLFIAVKALGSAEHNPTLDGTSILNDITYPEYIPEDLMPLHHRYVEVIVQYRIDPIFSAAASCISGNT